MKLNIQISQRLIILLFFGLGCQRPVTNVGLSPIKSTGSSAGTTQNTHLGVQPGKLQFYGSDVKNKLQANIISYQLSAGTTKAGEELPLKNKSPLISTSPLLKSSQFSKNSRTLVFGCSSQELQNLENSFSITITNETHLSTGVLSSSNSFQAKNIIICSLNIILGQYTTLSAKTIILKDVAFTSATMPRAYPGSLSIYTENLKLSNSNNIQMEAYQSPILQKTGPVFTLSVVNGVESQENGTLQITSKGANWPAY